MKCDKQMIQDIKGLVQKDRDSGSEFENWDYSEKAYKSVV